MSEDYTKGKEIGELVGELRSLIAEVRTHNERQEEWNLAMDKRVAIAERWIQTTTGKVIVLTAIFSIIGTAAYIFINWLIGKR